MFFASVFTKENMNELPAVKQCFQGLKNEKLRSFIVITKRKLKNE